MAGSAIVAVLEQLGERELEHLFGEGDSALDIARDQREVMEPPRGGLLPLCRGRQVPGTKRGSLLASTSAPWRIMATSLEMRSASRSRPSGSVKPHRPGGGTTP